MPSYDDVCQECFETFEIRISISEYAKGVLPKCPKCGSRDTLRAFSPVHVATRGRAGGTASQGGPLPGFGGGCCGGPGCCG
jgi:putative FmdB family regulatory protein